MNILVYELKATHISLCQNVFILNDEMRNIFTYLHLLLLYAYLLQIDLLLFLDSVTNGKIEVKAWNVILPRSSFVLADLGETCTLVISLLTTSWMKLRWQGSSPLPATHDLSNNHNRIQTNGYRYSTNSSMQLCRKHNYQYRLHEKIHFAHHLKLSTVRCCCFWSFCWIRRRRPVFMQHPRASFSTRTPVGARLATPANERRSFCFGA